MRVWKMKIYPSVNQELTARETQVIPMANEENPMENEKNPMENAEQIEGNEERCRIYSPC